MIAAACLVLHALGVVYATDGLRDQAGAAYEPERQFCVDRTNQYRATVHLPALARSAELERYADAAAAHYDD